MENGMFYFAFRDVIMKQDVFQSERFAVAIVISASYESLRRIAFHKLYFLIFQGNIYRNPEAFKFGSRYTGRFTGSAMPGFRV